MGCRAAICGCPRITRCCHDVILAEGLPAESYLAAKDWPNYPDRSARIVREATAWAWETLGYAALIVSGPRLEAARAWLDRRAGLGELCPQTPPRGAAP